MSLTFKIYTDLYTSHFNTHCHLSPSRWIHSQQPCVSSIFHQVLRVGQFQPGQKTKNESRFVFCISRFVLGVFRLAFKIHSLRLRTVVTSMAALVNCTSNFRKTEVPSIATGSHLHFKKHNKTRQNFKKTCTSEEREDNPSNRVSPFRLKVPLCLQKNHAQRSALSISSCAISCEVHARSVYIISVSLTSEKSAQNFVHEGRANHSIQRFQKKILSPKTGLSALPARQAALSKRQSESGTEGLSHKIETTVFTRESFSQSPSLSSAFCSTPSFANILIFPIFPIPSVSAWRYH